MWLILCILYIIYFAHLFCVLHLGYILGMGSVGDIALTDFRILLMARGCGLQTRNIYFIKYLKNSLCTSGGSKLKSK